MKILFACFLYFVLQDIYSYSYDLLFDRSRGRLIIVFFLLSLHWYFGTPLVFFYWFSVLLSTSVYLNTSRKTCNVITASWFDFLDIYMVFSTLKYTVERSRNDLWVHIDYYSPVEPNGILNWRVGGLTVGPYFHTHLFRKI